jgi:NADH:ubiquinone oxidoreductase subunit E
LEACRLMKQEIYSHTTSQSALVRVAEISARYKNRPDKLMDVILAVQKVVPSMAEDVAAVIAREMGLKQNEVYSFITFYGLLSVKEKGKYIIRMCNNAPCHVRGAREVMDAICDILKINVNETTEDGRFTVELCPCLGICDVSPAIMINDKTYGNLTYESAQALIKRYIREDV